MWYTTYALIALLEDLLADEEVEKKKRKLIEKHNLIMTVEMERGVKQMCNISELVEERGIEKGYALGMSKGLEQGIEQGITQGQRLADKRQIQNLMRKGYSQEQISDLLSFELDYIRGLVGM